MLAALWSRRNRPTMPLDCGRRLRFPKGQSRFPTLSDRDVVSKTKGDGDIGMLSEDTSFSGEMTLIVGTGKELIRARFDTDDPVDWFGETTCSCILPSKDVLPIERFRFLAFFVTCGDFSTDFLERLLELLLVNILFPEEEVLVVAVAVVVDSFIILRTLDFLRTLLTVVERLTDVFLFVLFTLLDVELFVTVAALRPAGEQLTDGVLLTVVVLL